MSTKNCSNCGNSNDPLLTNCLFCKSSLPVIDINSISNEQLVMNAGQWIGKLQEGYYIVKSHNSNDWTGRGVRSVRKAEIQGYAFQYLSLIQVRAISNTNLNVIYQELKNQYDIGVASDDVITKRARNAKKFIMWYAIVFLVFTVLMFLYFIIEKK